MSHAPSGRSARRWAIAFAGIVALAVGLAAWWFWGRTLFVSADELLAAGRSALKLREYERAERFARRVPRSDAAWSQAQLVAGEAALKAGRSADARGYFAAIPRDGSPTAVLAVYSQGEAARDFGRLTEALDAYEYVLQQQSDHAAARRRMAFLLGLTGQRWESLPQFLKLLRSGNWNLEDLALLGDLERPLELVLYLRRCADNAPDDLLVRLGLAADAVTAELRAAGVAC